MDLKLNTIAPAAPQKAASTARSASTQPLGTQGARGFSGALQSALTSVSTAQMDASRMQREVQMENPKVSLEETMVAIQKAQIGFQATLHVRNRMVQAYTDIMNMQV